MVLIKLVSLWGGKLTKLDPYLIPYKTHIIGKDLNVKYKN